MPIYMKYDGVTGNVTESGHTGWIELNSFNWGMRRVLRTVVGSTDDRESAAPSVGEVVVTKDNDVASVSLMQEALNGFGKTATIAFSRTAKGQLDVYLTLTLTNTLISGYSHRSNGPENRPAESLTLNFSQFEYKYTEMETDASPGTSSTVGYDLATAKTI